MLSAISAAGAACTAPGAPEGAQEWFPAEQIYKLCNNADWVPFRVGVTMDGDLTEGLIAHWQMDETAGGIATDISGNGNHGTLTNMTVPAAWGTGRYNNALMFDGVNDYVTVPHHASQNLESGYTFAAWMYFDSTADVGVHGANISKSTAGGWGSRWLIGRNSSGGNIVGGNIRLVIGHNYNSLYSSWYFPVDQWVHVAVTWDRNYIRFYANGVQRGQAAWTIAPNALGGDLLIGTGRHNWGEDYFKGGLDDVRLYNRALPLHEIKAVMTLSCAREAILNYDETLSRYKFCDGQDWKVIDCVEAGVACPSIGPCASPKSIEYLSVAKALAWCDGTAWQLIAQ